MVQNDVDVKVRLVVDSKTYNAALRQANKEAKEFKRKQSEAFKGAGGDISKVFGDAIGVLGKLAPALSAGAAAMAVAKKAMQESQTLTDEWGRVTESARASWEGFVDALVHADFGSYFGNMGRMIQQARDAADAIDSLDTAKIFTSRAMSEYDLAIRRARIVIKDPNSTAEQRREAGQIIKDTQAKQLSDAQRLSDRYMEAFASKLADYVTRKGSAASVSDFIERDEYGRVIAKKGSLFEKYYGTLTQYEDMLVLYDREKRRRGGKLTTEEIALGYDKRGWSNEKYAEMRAFLQLSDEKLKEMFDLYSAAMQEQSRIYSAMTENFEYLNRANDLTGGGTGGKAIAAPAAEGSIAHVEEQIKAATEAWKNAITQSERDAAEARRKVLEQELANLQAGTIQALSVVGASGNNLSIAGSVYNPNILPPAWRAEIKGQEDLGEATEKTMSYIVELSGAINQLGINASLVSPELAKAFQILSVLTGVVGTFAGGKFGAIFGGLSAIFGGFDTGGIVGGTSYRGDRLTAQVSSGEMILNRQQQRNLFDMIQGGTSGAPQDVFARVSGESLLITINNTLRRQGKPTIG